MNEVIDVVGIALGSLLLAVMLQVVVLVKRLFLQTWGNKNHRALWNGTRELLLPKGTGLPPPVG